MARIHIDKITFPRQTNKDVIETISASASSEESQTLGAETKQKYPMTLDYFTYDS